MKLLHIVESIAPIYGGIGQAALHLSLALAATKHEVWLHILQDMPPSASQPAPQLASQPELPLPEGCPSEASHYHHTIFHGGTTIFRQLQSILRAVAQHQIDLVHIHGMWQPIGAILIALLRRQGIAIALSPHGCLDAKPMASKAWKKQLAMWLYQRRALNSCTTLIAASEQERNSIARFNLRPKIMVIPHGLWSLPELAAKQPTKNVLFLSRVDPIKGLDLLIAAWAALPNASEWQLLIAGPYNAAYKQHLDEQIAARKISNIKFLGTVNSRQKAQLYRKADFFVLPSLSENFAIVVAEALAYGLPVITTTATPWSELEQYHCGVYIEPIAADLAQAIASLQALPFQELLAMGERGRSLVELRYLWSAIAPLFPST